MAEARIDKWLWASRIFKTRTIAAEACKKGRVSINGTQVKPSRMIKPGEVIQVKKPPVTYSFKVLQAIDSIAPSSKNYIEVLVSVDGPEPSLNYKIEQALENKQVRLTRILRKSAVVSGSSEQRIINYDEFKKISPIEMAKEAFLKKYGSEMPTDIESLLKEAIEQTEI